MQDNSSGDDAPSLDEGHAAGGGPAPEGELPPEQTWDASENAEAMASAAEREPERPEVDRGDLILQGLRGAAAWSWRFLLVVAAVVVILYGLGRVWVGVLPIILALIVSSVLWPPVRWLRRHRWPGGLAAAAVLLAALAVFSGVIAAIAPGITSQLRQVANSAETGADIVLDWLSGPPVNLQSEQLDTYVEQATDWLQSRASTLAEGALSTLTAVGSIMVTTVLVVVLTFFFLKDGHGFLPWMRKTVGRTAGLYLTEGLARVWVTLGGFLRAQAVVAAVDATFIGLGLVLLGVPLAFALAVITFFLSFIPIVGAFVAGGLAVLVALVSNGWVTALWVILIVIAVQQAESTFVAPLMHSRVMSMHPVIVLLGVAAGGTLWGVLGAFLAVPVLASILTLVRYGSEQLDLRTGQLHVDDLRNVTPQGRTAAELAESTAPLFALRARQAYLQAEDERGAAQVAMLGRTGELAASLRDRILSPILRRDRDEDEDTRPPH
ncbi:putative integral membrane protein [Serinicoccus hydrothermalis]|uniref:Putative integral membrane protein n=1 Tax=Serinicoccus hydrothermalis TaxID=1758689 RepID=A0A1B1N8K8_9MICO|nr:AI-2E family transporter [Serinicoccus hydrothermalis]ANS77756.1 putative integral membrane protein [Serinicoccus hydrothermalis]